MATKTLVDTNSVQTVQNKTFDNTNTLTMGTLTSPTINGTISGTAAILPTGATTARPLTTRFAEPFNVKDFGAIGDGVTDDTTVIQAAITAASGNSLYFPKGTYIASTLSVAVVESWRGDGLATVLKQKASTAGHFITLSGTSKILTIRHMTFDGNYLNQIAESTNSTIHVTAVGTATMASGLDVESCVFQDGNNADISMFTDATRATNEFLTVRGCTFLGGAEGTSTTHDTRSIDHRCSADFTIVGNFFDLRRTPVIFGRAGILVYDGFALASSDRQRGIIANNFLNRMGRSHSSSTLGCIDVYNYGRSVTITGNTIVNAFGRGIQTKADADTLTITGNVVDTVLGIGIEPPGGAISVNSSTNTLAYGNWVISANAIKDAGTDGIVVTGNNVDLTTFATDISVTGNTISNSGNRGITIGNVNNIVVSGNSIDRGVIGINAANIKKSALITSNTISNTTAAGVFIADTSNNARITVSTNDIFESVTQSIYIGAAALGSVCGNTIKTSAGIGIRTDDIGGAFLVANNVIDAPTPYSKLGTNSGLRVEHNLYATALSSGTREVTIASGVITAHLDYHTVDTEADAATDDLDTINGGHDGDILTLRAINGARDVVCTEAGNMELAGSFTLNNVEDTLTLRHMAGVWYELSRSDNGA